MLGPIIDSCQSQWEGPIEGNLLLKRDKSSEALRMKMIYPNGENLSNQTLGQRGLELIVYLKNLILFNTNTPNYNATLILKIETLQKMAESDCVDFIKVLKNWQVQESKAISSVLTRMGQAKIFPQAELDVLYKALIKFHKEIIKAPDEEVDPKWFEHAIKLKPKLQKMIDSFKSAKPVLVKRPSQIVDYPQSLTSGRGPMEQKILKSMYKNFIHELQGSTSNPYSVTFLQSGLKQLKLMFQDKPEEYLYKRVNSICNRLSRQSSKQAKQKMLRGQITPKQLAIDDEQIYYDERTREEMRKNQMAQLQASQTGFYDQMKKKINKDANEQCRLCHKNAAFCEDMKQTRAADQPMTRFMRCNACNQGWRD